MNFLPLLSLSLLASLIALVGGIFFLYNKKASKTLEKNAIPFAAGTMITVALLGLIPESFELIGHRSLWIVLASFVSAYIFENIILATHHHHHDHHQHGHKHEKKISTGTAGLVVVGDTIHNFIDGIAIGAAYLANPGLGVITAISTFLHEVPHEIGDFGILLKAKWKKKDILTVNVISALATVPGAFSIYFLSSNDTFIGGMLAVAAGIFLYLGAIDFIPQAFSSKRNFAKPLFSLVLGVLVMIGTLMLVPHTHPEGDDEHHDHELEQIDEHHDEIEKDF